MLVPNSQLFSSFSSGLIPAAAHNQFKERMDGVLYGLGRDVTVHLKPTKARCGATCVYNQTYKKWTDSSNQLCSSCKGEGWALEHRQTIYKANIRWTNQPYGDDAAPIRTSENFVRTKMVYAALEHIKESIGAIVDGVNVELLQQPRTTGFGATPLLYCVAIWKVVDNG